MSLRILLKLEVLKTCCLILNMLSHDYFLFFIMTSKGPIGQIRQVIHIKKQERRQRVSGKAFRMIENDDHSSDAWCHEASNCNPIGYGSENVDILRPDADRSVDVVNGELI